ncbi:paraquat-inducible protein A [Luteibacter sp. UNC138MFCol5.1]|uniref:paraquat-inducible protein A n=1 Tax=Luteibacter sp. UNC138MFCol5.1 TaxID=1502774 RepID=UPI0008BC17F2|nr:paraquat-inducible protein A [Luteibacter sp. UNC138MFCol5.1]SEO86086.1 paraquat-inducible protein A [Luteibacter sp. UNC138MFCol5.1]
MHTAQDLIVCEHCDSVYRRRTLARGEVADCVVCGAVLDRHQWVSVDGQFALIVTAFIVFVIANVSPIVTLGLSGMSAATTLWGAVIAMWNDGAQIVAFLSAMTLFFFPLSQILIFGWVLWFARSGRRAPWFAQAMTALVSVKPWSMIEVFMLGTLVAVVKAHTYFDVVPGAGIWAFGVLTLLITVFSSLDPRELWTLTREDKA